MNMNKKGFIKILEAIVALVIVLAYVISILPKAQLPTGDTPPELLSLQKVVFDEIQNDQRFRTCIIYGNVYLSDEDTTKTDLACVDELIRTSLPVFSAWKYAFRICTKQVATNTCTYASPTEPGTAYTFTPPDASITQKEQEFADTFFPQSGAVYTKSVFISVPDVTSAFTVTTDNGPPSDHFKTITLYMWSIV